MNEKSLEYIDFDLKCSNIRWRQTPLGALRRSPRPLNREALHAFGARRSLFLVHFASVKLKSWPRACSLMRFSCDCIDTRQMTTVCYGLSRILQRIFNWNLDCCAFLSRLKKPCAIHSFLIDFRRRELM